MNKLLKSSGQSQLVDDWYEEPSNYKEVTRGVIKFDQESQLLDVENHTHDGPCEMWGIPKENVDQEELEILKRWQRTRTKFVLPPKYSVVDCENLPEELEDDRFEDINDLPNADLISEITSNATDKKQKSFAVLVAETRTFPECEARGLLQGLGQFIDKNRFMTDEETVVATGAAIRKYALNMSETDFTSYAKWLAPSSTDPIPHEIELELVKALKWRVSNAKLEDSNLHNKTLDALNSICLDYLSPRLILDKNYAATAIHAVTGLTLLQSFADNLCQVESLLQRVAETKVEWFVELVEDSINDVIEQITGHSPVVAEKISESLKILLVA